MNNKNIKSIQNMQKKFNENPAKMMEEFFGIKLFPYQKVIMNIMIKNKGDKKMKYNSKKDTNQHIDKVRKYMELCRVNLFLRAYNHDHSKIEDPEKSIFDEYTPKLNDCTYGSEEYKTYLKEMGEALEHHYKVNDHHPEHFCNGIKDMNLMQLTELVCDWYSASQRYSDGDITKSIELNQERFGYTDELKNIIINTVKFLQEEEI